MATVIIALIKTNFFWFQHFPSRRGHAGVAKWAENELVNKSKTIPARYPNVVHAIT